MTSETARPRRVLILLASNSRQQQHLRQARRALARVLPAVSYTPTLWTEPEGSTAHNLDGTPQPHYLNQLAWANTTLDAEELVAQLKQIETALGRSELTRRRGEVPIDLDLMQHGEQRYHQSDWQRNYVRRLLTLLPPAAR